MLLLVSRTYIDSILRVDFLPSWEDNDIPVDELLFDNEHHFRKAQWAGKGQDIVFQCMPYFQSIQYHVDILPFRLK